MQPKMHTVPYGAVPRLDPPELVSWLDQKRFDPHEMFGTGVDLKAMEQEVYDEADENFWVHSICPSGEMCRHCNRYAAHANTLVIAVDGSCENNGRDYALGASAVYVGPWNPYNITAVLPQSAANPPTSQKAELRAGICALQAAIRIRNEKKFKFLDEEHSLVQVFIKADSAYLVKGMTEYISKWKKNGYINAKGTPVVNAELFRKLDKLVEMLNELDVEVFFWHVPREYNAEADKMARDAIAEALGL